MEKSIQENEVTKNTMRLNTHKMVKKSAVITHELFESGNLTELQKAQIKYLEAVIMSLYDQLKTQGVLSGLYKELSFLYRQ